MRNTLILLSLVLVLGAAPAFAATSVSTTLAGGSTGDPDGSGFAAVDFKSGQAAFSILVQAIDSPTAANIHRASDNTVELALTTTFTGNMAQGSVTVSSAVASAILGNPGAFYLSVRSTAFPNGALRGTLALAGGDPPDEAVTLHFPVVSKISGQAGTNFVTDLHLANPTSADVEATLRYYRENVAGLAAPSVTATVTIPAGRQVVVADVVGSKLGGTEERGGLQVEAEAAIRGQARVYNDLRGTSSPLPGTFSQYSPPFFASALVSRGYLLGLSQRPASSAQDFRTNIVYFNPTATAVTATFAAYKPDGTMLGSRQLTIPGYANDVVPVFELINTVPTAQQEQPSFFVTFMTSGALIVQASVVDNITGDGLFVLPLAY